MDKNEYTLNFLHEMLGGGETPDYSEQEQTALCGKIPMTMELFQSCLEACADAGNAAEFMDLFKRFPEQGQVWAAALHKELNAISASLEAQGIEVKEISDEDIQARWTAFRGRVRDEYGDEVADNLAEDIFSVS